jgi:hypothetical protein
MPALVMAGLVVATVAAVQVANGTQSVAIAARDSTTTSTPVATSTESTTTTTSAGPPTFYLVVGASASLGVQPNGVVGHNGGFTTQGYANDVVALEAARGVSLEMKQVGCMGETGRSMIRGDKCYKAPVTQLSTAVDFLHAHQGQVGLVTVDLGFNDVRPCLWVRPVATVCARAGIAAERSMLPGVIAQLRAAAGPLVRIEGFTYEDPFLMRYLKGASGRADAAKTHALMAKLNAALRQVYEAAQVTVVALPTVFRDGDTHLVATARGTIPQNVAQICAWTWMCAPRPYGPDDHPNKNGYLAIAKAVLATLP